VSRRRFSIRLAAAAIACVGLAACDAAPGGGGSSGGAVVFYAPTPSPGALSLLTEPDQGVAPIYAVLQAARHSIDLTMYELVDPQVTALLEQAAARGVAVRVVLDANREKAANKAAFGALSAHGVHVAWADTRYAATHEKAAVIDDNAALIMSLNLTSRYYDDTRDFAVLDRQSADVAAIEQVFDADFRHAKTPVPAGDDLIWSPGSEPALLAIVAQSRSTLLVENEEMALPAMTSALIRAAQRGVRVTVVMTRQDDWSKDFDRLVAAHVDVRTYSPTAALYIHAKAIVADAGTARQRAFVGSENFSAASLQRNRELGLLTADPALVTSLATTITADATGATPWQN
jgi:phosphatidylserine/phosphatidylglycerophosphate/cardiolipin synthase-like enzyme